MPKRTARLLAALLAACLLTTAFPPRGLAASGTDLRDYVNSASNGVADLEGQTVLLNDTGGAGSADAPYVIDKPVTIQNGTITVRAGGFVLGADVTFSNVELQFSTSVGNYIVANGHTLTLNNVRCVNRNGDNSCNIYGGAMTGQYNSFTVPAPGASSKIIISGNTCLQGSAGNTGNIYAGNLFRTTDGTNPTQTFSGTVDISVKDKITTTNALGTIYACGAQQTSANAAADSSYAVSGGVTVSGIIPNVNGSGSTTAAVYRGDGNLDTRTFTDLSTLTVESGKLVLTQNSQFRNNGTLSLSPNAKLDLKEVDGLNLNVHNFNGGGLLCLKADQSLNISGQVTGTTKLAIGDTNYDNTQSTSLPSVGHTYITAPNSSDGNFELLPYGNSGLTLVKDDNGSWKASAGGSAGDENLVARFQFLNKNVSAAPGAEAEFEMLSENANGDVIYLDDSLLTVEVNNKVLQARPDPDGIYKYIFADTLYEFTAYVAANTFCITTSEPGSHTIKITLPKAETADGTALSDTATLTVSGGGTPPQPGHVHSWSGNWFSDSVYHWHDCTAGGCDIKENSKKDGYGAHTPGAWIIDQAATPLQDGSRHKECNLCGLVTARETIPATGGSSSGGGGGGSSGGGSSTTPPQTNPDGSTTTTSTDKATGTVTSITKYPDGSQTTVATETDGTVTTTERAANGSTVKTIQKPDGSSQTTVNQANNVTAQVNVDPLGRADAQVSLPPQMTQTAQSGGETVVLPIPALPNTALLTVQTGSSQAVKLEVPLSNPTPGVVAILTHPDGSQEIVRTSSVTEGGLVLPVSDGSVLAIQDNSKSFSDIGGHWARGPIQFVSARELFLGTSPSTFAPEEAMTRGMLTTVLARLDSAELHEDEVWYAPGVDWAVTQGISDGSNPTGFITREQLVTMLHRYAGSPETSDMDLAFSDTAEISPYALDAMRWAVENGILSGYEDNLLAPGKNATRAQTAAIFMRYVDLLNQ